MRRLLFLIPIALLCASTACKTSEAASVPLPSDGPAAGEYSCWAGGFNNLDSGRFAIYKDGRYEDERPGGEGRFIYDRQKKEINFASGDFDEWGFTGVYQTAAESNNGRARIVLKDSQYSAEIGKERAGQFHYCYPMK